MRWIPSWLAKSYASIYVEKNTQMFDFEEAKSILKIDDKIMLSKRLGKLEDVGFVISKRDSVDRRKKYFRLIQPNDVIFSYGMRILSSSEDVIDRLVTAASKDLDFVVGGNYATYVHTGYATPGKIDIYVNDKDKDKLISLLSDKFTSISVDDVLSEKITKTNVHIHSSLTLEMIDNSTELDGITYVDPEILVIEGLADQSEFLLTDTFALLIKKRKELDFNYLLKIAKSENVERELGVCLEIINLESKKKFFDIDIINKIHSNADLSRRKLFPKNTTQEDEKYYDLVDKWNLIITFSKGFISKIILDLIK